MIGTVLCCAAFIYGLALGQESGSAESVLETPTPVDEEIIVRGRSQAVLRARIQQAEEALYDRFNEINSDDEFDIHCRRELVTGSHIPRRICQANFWRNAQAGAGQETVRGLQGGSAFNPQHFLAEAMYKRNFMEDEIRRLAADDKEFLRALTRVADLQQAMQKGELPLALSATASRQDTSAEQALPYDAALKADVQIGRKPWSHALTQRTFTIANLYGEIRSVDVRCRGRTKRLQYEAGVEWTLPDDWRRCELLVEAPLGTTFSLYEFE